MKAAGLALAALTAALVACTAPVSHPTESTPTPSGSIRFSRLIACDSLVGQPVGRYETGDTMHLAAWLPCTKDQQGVLTFPEPNSSGCYDDRSRYVGQWFQVQGDRSGFIFGRPGGLWKRSTTASDSEMAEQLDC
jgi:hypothetical protein